MKQAMIEMFEIEVRQAQRMFEQKPSWFKPQETVYNAIQRCLGVAHFVQVCPNPLTYEEVEPIFEATKEKLENLLQNY